MEPMMACASAVSPPMATPWITRAVSSSGIVSDRPAITEPATKITMLSWTRSFLSKRSASLPQIGVVAALASNAAVITQAKSVWVPLSSDMIVGSALATMVLLMIAVKKAASRPVRASMIWRWLIAAWGAGACGCGDGGGVVDKARDGPVAVAWLAMCSS
ncbi:hypothetical protein D9M72_431310 [compost metagenome]